MTSGPADTHIFHLNAIKKYKKCSKPTGSNLACASISAFNVLWQFNKYHGGYIQNSLNGIFWVFLFSGQVKNQEKQQKKSCVLYNSVFSAVPRGYCKLGTKAQLVLGWARGNRKPVEIYSRTAGNSPTSQSVTACARQATKLCLHLYFSSTSQSVSLN